MPKVNIKSLLAVLLLLPFSMAFAQSPSVPNLIPEAPNKVETKPEEFDPAKDTGGFNDIQRTPQAEKQTQINRQIERQQQLAAGGFKWISWSQITEPTMKFILDRDPKQLHITGNPKYRDFAVADIDGDNQPDILVYDWSQCVAAGCQFAVYFNNKLQKPVNFTANELKPAKRGVSVDGTVYEF